MSKGKVIYKCKVNGCLGRVGKAFGLCKHAGVNSKCCAHGNTKCVHKIREEVK